MVAAPIEEENKKNIGTPTDVRIIYTVYAHSHISETRITTVTSVCVSVRPCCSHSTDFS